MGVPTDARPVETANASSAKPTKTSAHERAARPAQSGATPSALAGPQRTRPKSAITTKATQRMTDAATPAETALSTVVLLGRPEDAAVVPVPEDEAHEE